MPLADWQSAFFAERVARAASGDDGVYFREQVFGAVEVLSQSLPELEELLGARNFRYFVRELLTAHQPKDALGTTLIGPFLEFLATRDELRALTEVQNAIRRARERAAEA
jgi:hypothetical protein